MKKIAITGATGHTGNNVCRFLSYAGYSVAGLVRDPAHPALAGMEISAVKADLFDSASLIRAFSGADTVVHTAGKVSIYPKDRKIILKTNIEGTRRVVDASLKAGVRQLIHISSVHAHRMQRADDVVNENTPYKGKNAIPYDRSKVEGEKIVLEARKHGLDTVILNPTGIIGIHDFKPSYMGAFLTDLYRGKMNLLIRGGFDWVDVQDIASAVEKIIHMDIANEKFILSGHFATLKQIAHQVYNIKYGRPYRGVILPVEVAYAGIPFIRTWSFFTGRLPLYTTDSLKAIKHGSRLISHRHASEKLGWQPRNFNETIVTTLRWLIDHYNLKNG